MKSWEVDAKLSTFFCNEVKYFYYKMDFLGKTKN